MTWNVRNWYYRGEGSANIVFAHKTDKIVLRLAKCPVSAYGRIFAHSVSLTSQQEPPVSSSNSANISMCNVGLNSGDGFSDRSVCCLFRYEENNLECEIKKELEDITTCLCFARYVMCPVLGSQYVDAGSLARVPKEFVCHIGELAKSARPNSRQHKTVVPADQIAVIMPDFCQIAPFVVSNFGSGDHLSPTVCVEIKPKQGFIDSKFSAVQTICRFCMFQHVKLNKGAVSHLSSYCPLDLFSGNYARTKFALASLFANPQNNLRVFADGKKVFGASSNCDIEKFQLFLAKTLFCDPEVSFASSASPLDRLTDLIIKVLWCNVCVSKANCDPIINLINKDQSKLPEGCVLERILKVQKLGDLDFPALLQQYQTLKELNRRPCHVLGDYKSLCWQTLVHSGMSDSSEHSHNLKTSGSCNAETSCDKLKRYLVAKTAMNCQIMLSLQPANDYNKLPLKDLSIEREDGSHVVIDVCDKAFRFSVKIIDLDPKDCDKMEYYCKQEADMLAVYAAASKSTDFIRKYCTS